MKKDQIKSILSSMTVVALLGFGQSVFAEATVYHENDNDAICMDSPIRDMTYCMGQKGVWHRTNTDSGNTIYHFKGTLTATVSITSTGEVFSSHEMLQRVNTLFKNGEVHQSRETYTENRCVNGFSEMFSWDYHFANGMVTMDNYEITPVPC